MFVDLEERIRKEEKISSFINNVVILEEIDSTNSYAKQLKDQVDGTLIVAKEQTQGRGRNNRTWKSFGEKNLTFSLIVNYPEDKEVLGLFSLLSANSVAATIEELGLIPEIKWPNDILINSRKVSGVLCEAVFDNNKPRSLIIGIGLNVNSNKDDFYSDDFVYRLEPTSLSIEGKKEYSSNDLVVILIKNLINWITLFRLKKYETILSFWRSRWIDIGSELVVTQDQMVLKGDAIDINSKGELLFLEKETKKVHVLNSGELST